MIKIISCLATASFGLFPWRWTCRDLIVLQISGRQSCKILACCSCCVGSLKVSWSSCRLERTDCSAAVIWLSGWYATNIHRALLLGKHCSSSGKPRHHNHRLLGNVYECSKTLGSLDILLIKATGIVLYVFLLCFCSICWVNLLGVARVRQDQLQVAEECHQFYQELTDALTLIQVSVGLASYSVLLLWEFIRRPSL